MKTKMDGEMRKLKSALKREKEKNALLASADGPGAIAGTKKKTIDENSVDISRTVKAVAAGKKDNTIGTGSTRAPLRSIFTGSQGVEEGPKREGADSAGRVESQDSRQPVAPPQASDARQKTAVRFDADQTRKTVLQLLDVFTEMDKPSGPSAIRTGPEVTGKRIDKPSSSRAEERERTIADEVLDTPPVRRTSKVERIQEIQEDIGGSTTEEDEEPHDAVMRDRPEPSLLRLGERQSHHAPSETLRPGNRPTRVEAKSNTRMTGPHTPVISVNTARTTNFHISKTTHTTETPNAASRPPTSIARTGSRVTRTPSGMQWLGGEKTKLTRRDSFEDEVGTSSRVKPPQAEVIHTLPRAMPVKASLAISAASTSKLPAMKRLAGRPEDDQQTPTRASHASSLKRKDMLQLETPAGPSVTSASTASRSEKRQKLTATR